ncbi:MAG: glycosyltransferase family 9 protein [Alphaproteobacteria bacterium]|nr:glycosyltransferase family 9 protein [Alphaproteobacteria bacterium]
MTQHKLINFNTIGIIVGRDLIGDALIKLPVLRSLRAACPSAKIYWITSLGPTAYAGQLRSVTRHLIDEVYEQPKWLASRVNPHPVGKAPAFDLILDTRNRWREALYARYSVPHKIFVSSALKFLFSDIRPPLFKKRPTHMVDRMLQLVEMTTGQMPASSGALQVSAEALRQARAILPEGLTYVGFAPGAGNMIKAWPKDRFAEVASLQAAKGRVPVFLLGPNEVDWQDELSRAVPMAKFPLQDYEAWDAPGITIEQTMAVGSLLTVAVSNDSWTGHMLAAVDCPLISLFGPTSPAKLAPRVTTGQVISAQDFGGSSMEYIPVEDVENAVNQAILLQKRG